MGGPGRVAASRHPIARQAALRLVLGLGLVVALVAISAAVLYRQAMQEAARERAEDVGVFYQARLKQLEREWELHARDLRVRIEHTRYLEGRNAAENLFAYLTIQGSNRRYSHLLIQDREGRTLFAYGSDGKRLAGPIAGRAGDWLFDEPTVCLFRVFEEKIWLGGRGMGRIVLLFKVDNALLGGLAAPGIALAVTYRGRPLAHSVAVAGSPAEGKAASVEQKTLQWGSGPDDPALLIRAPVRGLFSATALGVGVGVVPVIDALIIWFVLGTWFIRTTGRINVLGRTVGRFSADAETNVLLARQARLGETGRGDEIEEVSVAIESMAEQAAARERERREDEGRKRLWSQVFQASGEAIMITDRDNRIVAVNRAFEQSTGYRLEEVAGEDPKMLRGRREPPEFYREMWRRLLEAGFWRGEVWDKARDGRLYPVLLSISAVRGEDGGIDNYVASFVDISERKEQEQELELHRSHLEDIVRERTAELEASNRELEAFSYSVSHDLRSPLRGIEGFAQILEEDYGAGLDEVGRGHLRRIRRASHRMANLIDELLELARISRVSLSFAPVELAGAAREIAKELTESDPGRAVVWRFADRLLVSADQTLIRVALQNLLRNAWKFTRRASPAIIELGMRDLAGERQYFVKDNGVGFDPAYSEKLFKPFERLHQPGDFEGSGIGLAIVDRVIGRHGGRVWAESAPEGGATFYFTVSPPAPPCAAPFARGRRRGLVPG